MQRAKPNAKALDYYASFKQIFQELSRQARAKIPIPAKAKEMDFLIEEPLTDQEKEECCNLTDHVRLPIIHTKTYINIK